MLLTSTQGLKAIERRSKRNEFFARISLVGEYIEFRDWIYRKFGI